MDSVFTSSLRVNTPVNTTASAQAESKLRRLAEAQSSLAPLQKDRGCNQTHKPRIRCLRTSIPQQSGRKKEGIELIKEICLYSGPLTLQTPLWEAAPGLYYTASGGKTELTLSDLRRRLIKFLFFFYFSVMSCLTRLFCEFTVGLKRRA